MNLPPTLSMVAKTLYGLEEVLAEELRALNANDIQIGRRMVSFSGDLRMLYKANIHLRTALRILVPIATFEARNADEIYQYLYDNIDWSQYLTSRTTFAFDTVVYSNKFTHSKFVAYRGKDAISDFFTDRELRRPNVSVVDPDVQFHIHISDTTVSLSLDSSGESLHKRGYRVGQNDAPLSEVLAAAILLRAGWKGETNLLDPMCGSGTFLTEAALIALGIPPGIFREKYAFEKWKDFDQELLNEILDDWEERPFEHTIYGSDISPKAISISRANISRAGVGRYVQLAVKPIADYLNEPQQSEPCLIVTNPPYGERMRPFEIDKLYQTLGSVLKHVFTGNTAWVISSSTEGFNALGLKPTQKEKLFNGAIECELREYQLFAGSRSEHVREKVRALGEDPDDPYNNYRAKSQGYQPNFERFRHHMPREEGRRPNPRFNHKPFPHKTPQRFTPRNKQERIPEEQEH